jgi:hypothetical protein
MNNNLNRAIPAILATIAMVRTLHEAREPMPMLWKPKGSSHLKANIKLEVVAYDATARGFTLNTAEVGILNSEGRINQGGFPLTREAALADPFRFGGSVARTVRASICRNELIATDEENLVIQGGRKALERFAAGHWGKNGAHELELQDFEVPYYVSPEQVAIATKVRGKVVTKYAIPELLEGRLKNGKIRPGSDLAVAAEALGLSLDTSDEDLILAAGGDPESRIPKDLVHKLYPEMVVVDATTYGISWQPVNLASIQAFGAWVSYGEASARLAARFSGKAIETPKVETVTPETPAETPVAASVETPVAAFGAADVDPTESQIELPPVDLTPGAKISKKNKHKGKRGRKAQAAEANSLTTPAEKPDEVSNEEALATA